MLLRLAIAALLVALGCSGGRLDPKSPSAVRMATVADLDGEAPSCETSRGSIRLVAPIEVSSIIREIVEGSGCFFVEQVVNTGAIAPLGLGTGLPPVSAPAEGMPDFVLQLVVQERQNPHTNPGLFGSVGRLARDPVLLLGGAAADVVTNVVMRRRLRSRSVALLVALYNETGSLLSEVSDVSEITADWKGDYGPGGDPAIKRKMQILTGNAFLEMYAVLVREIPG